jgi:aryl-alcohol dehydrogenase-like predicted oxidoreductase
MNIGLGTVQLGLPYGNKSNSDLMPESGAFSILSFAVERGIDFYDTAIAYGESESRIGSFKFRNKYPAEIS